MGCQERTAAESERAGQIARPVPIKPHHLLDMIRDLGEGRTPQPHPYGHAYDEVARLLLEALDCPVQITLGADAVCEPCKFNDAAQCTDITKTPGYLARKRDWNLLIDKRLCDRLGLKPGQVLSVGQFCQLARRRLGAVHEIWREAPPQANDSRQAAVEAGLAKLLSR